MNLFVRLVGLRCLTTKKNGLAKFETVTAMFGCLLLIPFPLIFHHYLLISFLIIYRLLDCSVTVLVLCCLVGGYQLSYEEYTDDKKMCRVIWYIIGERKTYENKKQNIVRIFIN
jgi:hypothetical protein